MATILSVNAGIAQPLIANKKVVQSAIFKRSIEGPVQVLPSGLAGDERVDHAVKGATERAVYAYPSEHYPFWRNEYPAMKLPFGVFGENLTTQGIHDRDVFIGDRYQVGSAILTVTQPRMPCYKLAARFQRADIIERMIAVGRHGFFFAVTKPGIVSAGDAMQLLHREPASISVVDTAALYSGRLRDPQLLERALAIEALPKKWKTKFAQRASA
jgi:MOSC domain-containing protein YiiM